MQRSRTRKILTVALIALLASACNEPTQPVDDAQSLIIYTGRDKDEVAHVVNLFTLAHPQYKDKVETVILGAQEALTRLSAEQDNPQAGFLWGGTLQGLQQAAREQLLAPS